MKTKHLPCSIYRTGLHCDTVLFFVFLLLGSCVQFHMFPIKSTSFLAPANRLSVKTVKVICFRCTRSQRLSGLLGSAEITEHKHIISLSILTYSNQLTSKKFEESLKHFVFRTVWRWYIGVDKCVIFSWQTRRARATKVCKRTEAWRAINSSKTHTFWDFQLICNINCPF